MAFIKAPLARRTKADARDRARRCDDLVAQLATGDASSRRRAARDLADCPTASAPILAHLATERDPAVQDALITTLTTIGDDVAVQGLADCLRSEDVPLRNAAVEALKLLPDAVAAMVSTLLADPNADVRIHAVNVLESLRHPDVESWLIAVLDGDPHVNVCATAVDLLGEVGTDSARDALGRLKGRFPDEPYIQFAADLALQRINAT